MRKTAIIAATAAGHELAQLISRKLPGSEIIVYEQGVRRALEKAWASYDGIVCVMASGIVVRCLNGLCQSKYHDPCVVVVDEEGRHAISLLSGHIGGGNSLAGEIADICGGTAVITTASDVSGHTAVDLWTVEEHLTVVNPERLAAISSRLLQNGTLKVYQERNFIKSFPDDFRPCTNRQDADIVIALVPKEESGLLLIPRIRFIGFGCRRGASVEEFKQALADLEAHEGLELRSVGGMASIDLKNDEEGLLKLGLLQNWPIRFFSKEQINSVAGPTRSDVVHQKIGVFGVCESAAILAASVNGRMGQLIIKKRKWERITAAVAEVAY